MYLDQDVSQFNSGISELNDSELSAINGGIVPAYIGVRVGFAVGTIVVLAAIDYFND